MIRANKEYEGRTDDHVYVGLEGSGKINQALLNIQRSYADGQLVRDVQAKETPVICGNPVTNEYSWDRTENFYRKPIFND